MSDMPKKLVNYEHLNLVARKLNSKIKEKTNYLNEIDYDNLLAFDTSEITFRANDASPILDTGRLDSLILGDSEPSEISVMSINNVSALSTNEYQKTNFFSGQVLKAEHLNNIENGIVANEDAIENTVTKDEMSSILNNYTTEDSVKKLMIKTLLNAGIMIMPENFIGADEFVYYNSIESSIADIANNSIGVNSITQDMNPEVAVYNFEDVIYLILLRNCKIESTITINNDIVLMLNGYEINTSDTTAIQIEANKVIIDGRANGSKINVDTSIEANNIAAIQLISGECTINGGEVNSLTTKAGERANPNGMIVTEGNTTLTINNVKLLAKDEVGGAINAVLVNENSTLIANNCNIVADSKNGLSPDAIYSYGNIELNNCYIDGKSDHIANAAGNDYGATSRGVNSQAGSANIINCIVKGSHSGMTAKGDLFVKDCVFESYSHGGIYVSSADKTVYLSNSIIRQCEMPDGYIADSIAGTNNAGIYIGGASNITLYVDGCTFYGIQQPIVLRGSSGESNNHLYISNSNINLDYKNYGIRNDGSNQTHFGIGNNFGPTDLKYNRNYEETGIDYGETIDNH